jgi:hypothetical protein
MGSGGPPTGPGTEVVSGASAAVPLPATISLFSGSEIPGERGKAVTGRSESSNPGPAMKAMLATAKAAADTRIQTWRRPRTSTNTGRTTASLSAEDIFTSITAGGTSRGP